MRKTRLFTQVQSLYADRSLFLMIGPVALFALIVSGILLVSIHPQDIPVAVRYSAFGETHFYRQQWYYIGNFILFIFIMTVLHIGLLVKLYRTEDLKGLAVGFTWLTLLLLAVAGILFHSILGVTFLQ